MASFNSSVFGSTAFSIAAPQAWTFATLPHTRLLNIILKHFYSALATDFSFYHTAF